MPSIPELELQLAGARDGVDRLDALTALATALAPGDPRRAVVLAEEACRLARAALPQAQRTLPRTTLVSAALVELRLRLARALHMMGRCRKELSEYATALAALDEARALFEGLGDRAGASDVIIEIGATCFFTDDFDAAVAHLTRGLAIKNELGDKQNATVALGNLGMVYRMQGNDSRALGCYQQCLAIFLALEDRDGQATAHFNIGIVYHVSGNYTLALNAYQQGLALFETLGSVTGMAHSLNNIGSLYKDLGDFPHANDIFIRSLELKERTGDLRGAAITLSNLSTISRQLGRYPEAFEFSRRSIEIAAALDVPRIHANSIAELASIHLDLGDHDAAIMHARSVLAICEPVAYTAGVARALILIGRALRDQKQYQPALDAFTRAHAFVMQGASKLLVADVHKELAATYKLMGRYKPALDHFEEFHTLNGEMFNAESDKRVRTLMASLDLERVEREASILRLTNQQLEQDVEFKKRELTTTAMYLTQKNEFLHKLRRQIRDLEQAADPTAAIRSMIRDVDEAVDADRSWGNFEQQFHQVHKDFLGVVAAQFPSLTPTELKVCSLIKIDLSSKEIARILNTEVRTIERYRGRIRKKLGISQQENLSTLLAGL